ncbi:OLC1v1037990C1 [Oldenlandia corymbosa var. corymbosa]|uniref:glucan endo-1,3-beta-D-glucosidase n=1 Tax=Oldenlandia corymbosa var. corymbosa TaxID=529605 RepID=A0AAV1D2F9_OLDCO|nr:OLC1v1037990C1 [Oldenlandia corymbosa var. corymbosa]
MKILQYSLRLIVLHTILIAFTSDVKLTVTAFTGTYGINYGRIANNLPSPDKVAMLLRAAKIKNVRIYDADHSVLKAFSGTGLELIVGLSNEHVKDVSSNSDHALTWVKDNVEAFLPDTKVVGIAIGNEILGNNDNADIWGSLLDAAKNIYNATQKLGIDKNIQISTAHSQAVFDNSFPPSNCTFREGVTQYMKPLLEFFSSIGSPFCLNAYPFLAYTYNSDKVDINYALFEKNEGIYDEKTRLHYDNLLDAQIDAAYAALEEAGYGKMEVIITETGWASKGDQSEPAATVENARTYNFNLRKRLALRKGTPFRPKIRLKAYIFALFNENSKPGHTSENNYGLYKPDGSIAYDIGFPGLKSSSAVSSFLTLKGIPARGFGSSASVLVLSSLLLLLIL